MIKDSFPPESIPKQLLAFQEAHAAFITIVRICKVDPVNPSPFVVKTFWDALHPDIRVLIVKHQPFHPNGQPQIFRHRQLIAPNTVTIYNVGETQLRKEEEVNAAKWNGTAPTKPEPTPAQPPISQARTAVASEDAATSQRILLMLKGIDSKLSRTISLNSRTSPVTEPQPRPEEGMDRPSLVNAITEQVVAVIDAKYGENFRSQGPYKRDRKDFEEGQRRSDRRDRQEHRERKRKSPSPKRRRQTEKTSQASSHKDKKDFFFRSPTEAKRAEIEKKNYCIKCYQLRRPNDNDNNYQHHPDACQWRGPKNL